MTESTPAQQPNRRSYAIASLVLGILAIVTSLVWFIAIILGVIAIIFGILAIKSADRGKALAGIITGSLGVVMGIAVVVIVFSAVPSLQKNQRDTARKNDLSVLMTGVASYQTNNKGQLPSANDLSVSDLLQVTSVTSDGTPTTEAAVYRAGKSCDGAQAKGMYSMSILLEDKTIQCLDS
ncbi:DUF4190 domain-containing protein [bacterium]|nr:MAG: DUF4190 domain-containing protein [bacterium]